MSCLQSATRTMQTSLLPTGARIPQPGLDQHSTISANGGQHRAGPVFRNRLLRGRKAATVMQEQLRSLNLSCRNTTAVSIFCSPVQSPRLLRCALNAWPAAVKAPSVPWACQLFEVVQHRESCATRHVDSRNTPFPTIWPCRFLLKLRRSPGADPPKT